MSFLQDLHAHIRGILPGIPLPESEKTRLLVQIGIPEDQSVVEGFTNPLDFELVKDSVGLEALVSKLKGWDSAVVLDIETSSVEPEHGEIVSVGLRVGESNFYLPLTHRDGVGALLSDQLPLLAVVQAVPFQELKIIAHNAKFECRWLKFHAGVELNVFWDTLIAETVFNFDNRHRLDLESLASDKLGVSEWALTQEQISEFAKVPLLVAASYNAKDLIYTNKLYDLQKEEISNAELA